jgi:hypothetical protein
LIWKEDWQFSRFNSNSITDCNKEIKNNLKEVRLELLENFKRSHNDLINRIMLIEKGGNTNREELVNLLKENNGEDLINLICRSNKQ